MNLEYKHSLNIFFVYNDLVNKIVEKIKEIPNYENLKLDVELTLHICNIIENIITKKDKVDKKK